MIKYIGIFILASSVSAYGSFLSSSLRESYNLRYEIIQLLKDIERCIKYKSVTIADTVRESKLQNLSKCGFCDRIFSGNSIESVINTTLSTLSKKDREILINYFSQVGKTTFSELELKNCSFCIDYFEKTQEKYEKEVTSKSLLYKRLGLIMGILTAIIFI